MLNFYSIPAGDASQLTRSSTTSRTFRYVLFATMLGTVLLTLSLPITVHAQPVSVAIGKFRGGWEASVSYKRGEIVTYEGAVYINLLKKNLNAKPGSAATAWSALSLAGSHGKDGQDGQNGLNGKDGKDGAKGEAGASFNPLRIAMKRWYGASQTGLAYPVGDAPIAAAFDGAYLWIANQIGASVSKLRPSDGSVVTTYPLASGATPNDILFDGAYLWVASATGLKQLNLADGSQIRSVTVGTNPVSLTFDGDNVWVASGDGVYKVKASSGAITGPFAAGQQPSGIAFDGHHIWVGSAPDSTFTKLNPADGSEVAAIHWLGGNLQSMAFDGTYMWILKSDPEGKVTKVQVSDGTTLGNYPAGTNPTGIVFDGTHIWVSSVEDHAVRKFNPADGSLVATYLLDPASTSPSALVFDGAKIWVLNRDHDTLSAL